MQEYVLNGTSFIFDEKGFLKGLSWQGNSFMTQGKGLFDLAQPVKYDHENIRLEPNGAKFDWDGKNLTLTYEQLGTDVPVGTLKELEGGVSATLLLKPMEDGQSVSMQLKVTNHASAVIRQVMFPFFKGLNAIDGEYETAFTTLGFRHHPYRTLTDTPKRRVGSFASQKIVGGVTFESGGYINNDNMIGRYYDYGSLKRGFSLYHRHWGYGPDDTKLMRDIDLVHIRLIQDTRLLWVGGIHYVNIEQGESYESNEYIFTPHQGGWENGITPYKEWVDQHKNRVKPVAESIQNALGFRSIRMKQTFENDPDSIAWKYEDLPKVGEDMKEHGLTELNIWASHPGLLVNKENISKALGGFEAYKEAVVKLREMGINPSVFVSFVAIWHLLIERYGATPGMGKWNQISKSIPALNAPYIERGCAASLPQSNELWKSDVNRALRFFRDELGIPSISWDQYLPNTQGDLTELLNEYCRETAEMYPDFVFSGESLAHFEEEIDCLDYTWNWAYPMYYGGNTIKLHAEPRDSRPYQYVVGTTRLNINIDNDPSEVKRCFAENILMNIFPSKPNQINGSALISDYPEFSATIKRAAKLREKYLAFFRNGVPVGDCVLDREAHGLRVSGYRMPKKTMVMIYSQDKEPEILPDYMEREEVKARSYKLPMSSLNGWKITESLNFDTNKEVDLSFFDGNLEFSIKEGELFIVLFEK